MTVTNEEIGMVLISAADARRIDNALHTAAWAAGKLEVEMVYRCTVMRRAEFEALVNIKDELQACKMLVRNAASADNDLRKSS